MSCWTIIDDRGRTCNEKIHPAIHRLNGSMSEREHVDYLIINCGFVAMQRLRQHLHVRFRPALVGGGALAQLLFRIYDDPWRRALATTFSDGAWRHAILPAAREAVVEHIANVVLAAQGQSHQAVLRRVREPMNVHEMSPMSRALHAWKRRCGTVQGDLHRVLNEEIGGRYVWVNARPSGELIMEEIGGGFPKTVDAALRPGVGHRLQDQPDMLFGRYCAEAYGHVAQSKMPMLEDVDAFVAPPLRGRIRRRYTRLILPFRSRRGGLRLLGVSLEDPGIDLRRRAL